MLVDDAERGANSDHCPKDNESMTDFNHAPPAPLKYTKNQKRGGDRSAFQTTRVLENCCQRYIEATRRHTIFELCKTDMCPVYRTAEQADLWAALEDIFLR